MYIGTANALMPTKRQAITMTNYNNVLWHHKASLRNDDITTFNIPRTSISFTEILNNVWLEVINDFCDCGLW